jgi:hypothetical protein
MTAVARLLTVNNAVAMKRMMIHCRPISTVDRFINSTLHRVGEETVDAGLPCINTHRDASPLHTLPRRASAVSEVTKVPDFIPHALAFANTPTMAGGVDLCQTLGGPNPFPPHPYPLPLLSLLPFSPFPLSPLPLPSLSLPLLPSLGVRGLCPRKIFFRYTCSHASFSAFLTQKSAVYLTRFPDNNFAFLHES